MGRLDDAVLIEVLYDEYVVKEVSIMLDVMVDVLKLS